MQPQQNLQQNTVCLEQQIYASQDKFTQPMVVMVETFRRSGIPAQCVADDRPRNGCLLY